MSRRLVKRLQVINCGDHYCGRCKQRSDNGLTWCEFFNEALTWDGRGFPRLFVCMAAEVYDCRCNHSSPAAP